ncbi:type II toxin-antitoxin system VapB family antitoxin [Candidatus Poriferisodalis sp.]|uniref:type II toxin-antitoxin system VapB family antitoxin n=1 Tax=Candidatus Poriferisodalis sp. TaxID=3101277 RepID=UPI003B5196CE
MARTNIDIDEAACSRVMVRYGLTSKRAAVNFALELAAEEPMSLDEALAMRGSGWEGDLEAMRGGRIEHL